MYMEKLLKQIHMLGNKQISANFKILKSFKVSFLMTVELSYTSVIKDDAVIPTYLETKILF
jgi:hypothetical protein